MQKDPFLSLPPAARTSFFVKAADGTTLPPQAIEKDWWVTKVLQAIRSLESVGIPREAYRLSNNDNGVPTQDPVQIYIDYDSAFPPEGYILPRVMLEVSGRSYEAAVSKRKVCSLMDERLPGNAFSSSPFMVFTVEPERTFIEKVCLLHEEFNKSPGDIRSYRMSRHLYDLFMMCNNKKRINEKALASEELFQGIVMHRFIYNRVDGVDYNTETPGHFKILPPDSVIDEWRKDYDEMMRGMIYSEDKPTFDEILARIQQLNTELNEMKWKKIPVFSPGAKPYLI